MFSVAPEPDIRYIMPAAESLIPVALDFFAAYGPPLYLDGNIGE